MFCVFNRHTKHKPSFSVLARFDHFFDGSSYKNFFIKDRFTLAYNKFAAKNVKIVCIALRLCVLANHAYKPFFFNKTLQR